MKKGHSNRPYLILSYENGELVSDFSFERIQFYGDCDRYDNKKVTDLLVPISVDELESRIGKSRVLTKE